MERLEYLYSVIFKTIMQEEGDLCHPKQGHFYVLPFLTRKEIEGGNAWLALRGYRCEFHSYSFQFHCLPDRINVYLFFVAVIRKKIPLVKEMGRMLMQFLMLL
jgi:hypothetical protein